MNDYRRRITEPIERHSGVIDKFIGDGVVAILGVPEPGNDDARRAVMAGLALVSTIGDWRAERPTPAQDRSPVNKWPLRFGSIRPCFGS